MHQLEKEILAIIQRDNLTVPGDRLVIGVSGGPDSMALLHILAGLRGKLELELVAAYVDHGLRPDESPFEEELVKSQAEALSVSVRIGKVDARREARKRKISIEHAARDLRYDFFNCVAMEEGAAKIAVAHTADDQAEEVVLRLLRGTGRSGLSGMKTLREGKIIRPFLETSKHSVLSFLGGKNIPYCQDSSNLDATYLRNRIRLELMPFLSEINPNISEVLRNTARVLQDEEIVLNELAKRAWNSVASLCQPVTEGELPAVAVSLADFLALDRGIRRRIIERVFIEMHSKPQFKKIESILLVAEGGETGKQLHFARGLRMKKEKEKLLFSYPQGITCRRGNL